MWYQRLGALALAHKLSFTGEDLKLRGSSLQRKIVSFREIHDLNFRGSSCKNLFVLSSSNRGILLGFTDLMRQKNKRMKPEGLIQHYGILEDLKSNRKDGIFISQDKYVAEILKKFDFVNVKTASTPIETQKPLVKDNEASDVYVHLYRSMIGSLMYLNASRPDIMFVVCACSRFQVTPKSTHLSAVKRIFSGAAVVVVRGGVGVAVAGRGDDGEGKPKLGLWYPRVYSFDLESYSDSDYAGANLDRKSTTGGCQFLGRRLISWQCKKQTIVATFTTEAEYVAAANCCGQNPVYHSKTKHIAIRHHFKRDAYENKLIQVLKIHTDDNVADLLTNAFDVSSSMGIRESLRRVFDGTEALLLPTLFILWLATVSTDSVELVPMGKVSTAIEMLQKNTAKALISLSPTITHSNIMAVLESCPKHNMVTYLEKTDGNAEFHEIIDFLTRSSIHHALTFWTSAKSKIINNVRHISAKVAGKPVSISEASIISDLLFDDANGIDSLPNQAIFDAIQLMGEAPVEPQTDPSPRPSPSTTIPDSIPYSSGRNHGGHSSSDKSLLGNEGEMTLQSVYDLCISLCTQVSDQAKEIQNLKAQIKKLKKQAKPIITHHRAWIKSVSLKHRLAGKRSLRKTMDAKKSRIQQGRITEDAQDVRRTRDMWMKRKRMLKESLVLKMYLVLLNRTLIRTDKEKVSTDRPIVSTDGSKVSTDKQKDSTDDQNEGTDDHTEGERATQTTQTPTSTIFGDDETIAQDLGLHQQDPFDIISLFKNDPKDKGKKKIEEEDESESESDGIPEAEKKFKQLASDEEMARKARIEADRLLAEKLQEEEREQFTIEERAKFLHDTIAAQRKFLAQQRSEAIGTGPPQRITKKSNETYLKHVTFKHS
ncbi:hypothetical protein Tco_0379446 [Tanacetum coccineum]